MGVTTAIPSKRTNGLESLLPSLVVRQLQGTLETLCVGAFGNNSAFLGCRHTPPRRHSLLLRLRIRGGCYAQK